MKLTIKNKSGESFYFNLIEVKAGKPVTGEAYVGLTENDVFRVLNYNGSCPAVWFRIELPECVPGWVAKWYVKRNVPSINIVVESEAVQGRRIKSTYFAIGGSVVTDKYGSENDVWHAAAGKIGNKILEGKSLLNEDNDDISCTVTGVCEAKAEEPFVKRFEDILLKLKVEPDYRGDTLVGFSLVDRIGGMPVVRTRFPDSDAINNSISKNITWSHDSIKGFSFGLDPIGCESKENVGQVEKPKSDQLPAWALNLIDALKLAQRSLEELGFPRGGVVVDTEPNVVKSDLPKFDLKYASRLNNFNEAIKLCDNFCLNIRALAKVSESETLETLIKALHAEVVDFMNACHDQIKDGHGL